MSATRPAILAALKAILVSGVTAVSGHVYLPWDALPETVGDLLQIEVSGHRFERISLAHNDHFLTVRIGAVKKGKYDAQAAWDMLDAACLALHTDYTLSGTAINITVLGGEEHITEAGDRILWPHLEAEIHYRTAAGHL